MIEKLKGCYKCTNWRHLGDACFIKSKTNCTDVTGGVTCSGAHHKLLHGSGVAFCHKVEVIANQTTIAGSQESEHDEIQSPPDAMQLFS